MTISIQISNSILDLMQGQFTGDITKAFKFIQEYCNAHVR